MAKALPKSIKDLMSEFSRRWKKHANPKKWRKTNGGWVGNKSYQFPS